MSSGGLFIWMRSLETLTLIIPTVSEARTIAYELWLSLCAGTLVPDQGKAEFSMC